MCLYLVRLHFIANRRADYQESGRVPSTVVTVVDFPSFVHCFRTKPAQFAFMHPFAAVMAV